MKILFVGDLNPLGRSSQRKRALEESGHRIIPHSSTPYGIPPDWKPALLGRVLWKAGLPPDLTGTNAAITEGVTRHRPDILWIEKGNTVWPWTLARVRRAAPDTRIVSYTEDDMSARHNRSVFYRQGLKHYDTVFTTKSYNCRPEELPRMGARRVFFVDKAYDAHLHRPLRVDARDVLAFGGDVTFVGSYEASRAQSLLALAEAGVRVRVWGAGQWVRLRGHTRNLRVENAPLFGDDYIRALCASRINLCFLRKMNRDLQTDRTMELPACGAFMLAERTPEHLRLFAEGREAAYFGSDAELVRTVQYYLDHEEERAAIAAAGRRRCLESGYSHHERLRRMLDVVHGGAMGTPETFVAGELRCRPA